MWDRTNGPIRRTKFISSGGESSAYSAASSHQIVEADLYVAAGAGKDATNTAHLAAMMGNIIGASLTKTGNFLAGLIGKYSVTGALAARSGAGAVLGIIADLVTAADGAFVAVLDGDSGVTTANSFYGVKCNNSTPGSGVNFGLDLQSAAHDGYRAIDKDFYLKSVARLVGDVCLLVGTAVPTDGVAGTGVTFAGPGSLYFRMTDASGTMYVNNNTKASPTWKLVTQAA